MTGASLVLPVGFRLGPETEPEPRVGTVRLGWQRLGLDPDEARVWDLAHGAPGDHPLAGADLLLEHAQAAGVADPGAVVAALEARSLLVRVPVGGDDPEALRTLARRLRARALLVGVGAGQTAGTVVLGIPGWPALELPEAVALRWEDTAQLADLWAAAQFSLVREHGAGAPPATDDQVLTAVAEVVGDLPVLLAHHCGYLDLAVP